MMVRRLFAVFGLALLALVGFTGLALPASAHPLGNFTVNHANDIVVSPEEVVVTHVVDLAEIPTVQAMPSIDTSSDDVASSSELGAYAATRCADDARALALNVGGAPVLLQGGASTAAFTDGQAGLNTLRVECELRGAVEIGAGTSLAFTDSGATDATGWSEVTLRGDEVSLDEANVPDESPTASLTAYPADRETSPLRVSSATAVLSLGGGSLADSAVEGTADEAGSTPWEWAAELLGRTSSAATGPIGMTVALLIAIAVGAAHAMAPGHGKSLVAFALAGREERAGRAALTVGVTVTATHTASVLVLGLVVAGSASVVPVGIYSVLSVITGVVILVMGAVLLRNALRGRGHTHTHGDGHTHGHDHGHPHGDGHAHPHSHADPHGVDTAQATATMVATHEHASAASVELPPARRGLLVTLGITGGLLPSPSAVVVLLAAVAAGRAWYGVLLVVAFGIGMAATLAGVGFAVLRGQQRLLRWADATPRPSVTRVLRWAPVATAGAVLAAGVFLVAAAL